MLSEIQDDQLRCRTFGHSWEEFNPLRTRMVGGWELTLRCTRCSMQRFDQLGWDGRLISRYYTPPAGYRVEGRTYVSELRQELARRKFPRKRRRSG